MRFHHLLLSLAVIFITIIAVEGLPQSASPTPSPQVNESPAKQQTTKKKGWWPFASSAKATPAKAKATASPIDSPTVDVGKTKKQKKESADIPAEGPVAIATPRPPTAKATPHMIGVKESATPAPGGGNGLVWVNSKTHVYHSQKSRWYGTTREGKYMTEEEAKADGNRPARSSE
jgi:hypothetical protein